MRSRGIWIIICCAAVVCASVYLWSPKKRGWPQPSPYADDTHSLGRLYTAIFLYKEDSPDQAFPQTIDALIENGYLTEPDAYKVKGSEHDVPEPLFIYGIAPEMVELESIIACMKKPRGYTGSKPRRVCLLMNGACVALREEEFQRELGLPRNKGLAVAVHQK